MYLIKSAAVTFAVLCFFSGCHSRSLPKPQESSDATGSTVIAPVYEPRSEQNEIIVPESNVPIEPESNKEVNPEITNTCFDEDAIDTEMLHVADVCLPVYREMERNNIFFPTDLQQRNLLEAISALGYPSAGKNMDMTNYQRVLDFCELVKAGLQGDIGIYTWDNGLMLTSFHTEGGMVYRTHNTLDWTEDFTPVVSPMQYVQKEEIFLLTEKGWLFYGADKPPYGHYAYKSGMRVLPLGEDKQQMLRYLEPLVNYGGHNVLSESWNDSTQINYNDLFEHLYFYNTGKSPDYVYKEPYIFSVPYIKAIPAADFEALVQRYFQIEASTLREISVYDSQRQVYAMETLMHPLYVPDWEVVDYHTNADGSITLTVDAVSVSHGRDRVAVNTLTIMPLADGSFRYLSNRLDYAENNSDGMKSFPAYEARVSK